MNSSDIKKYYEDLYNAQVDSIKTDTETALKEYDLNKQQLNKSIDDANRSLYTSYAKAQTNLPAQLARQGITGGASETANIQLNSNYINNLTSNEQARAEQLNTLENKIAALRETSRASLAELRAQNALQKYNALTAAETEAYNRQKAAEAEAYQRSQADFANRSARAQTLASMGYYDALKEIGYTDAEIAWLKAQGGTGSSAGGATGGTQSGGNITDQSNANNKTEASNNSTSLIDILKGGLAGIVSSNNSNQTETNTKDMVNSKGEIYVNGYGYVTADELYRGLLAGDYTQSSNGYLFTKFELTPQVDNQLTLTANKDINNKLRQAKQAGTREDKNIANINTGNYVYIDGLGWQSYTQIEENKNIKETKTMNGKYEYKLR